jgi:hypothetical protein
MLEHFFAILPRRDFDSVRLVVGCTDEDLSGYPMPNTLGEPDLGIEMMQRSIRGQSVC